jgi:hypothetical protein
VRVVRAAGGRQTRVRGWKGGWAADPRERMEGRTGFFSSSFVLVVEINGFDGSGST